VTLSAQEVDVQPAASNKTVEGRARNRRSRRLAPPPFLTLLPATVLHFINR